MGIMTRKQGESYVITSDRNLSDAPTNRAPKANPNVYVVWTGNHWSTSMDEAQVFETLEDADEYVRANYANVSGKP